MSFNRISDIDFKGNDNKFVGGNDNSTTNIVLSKDGKLSSLFNKLKEKFEHEDTISNISEDLLRYKDKRDRIGLKKKLEEANRLHLYDDFIWLKEQYAKKLTRFQFYEPAQEIHSYILGIVYDKFRNLIYPMIRENKSEREILATISNEITHPIVSLIEEEGSNDIMGLSNTEIEGMIHYLTGQCHIKWKL